MKSETKYIFSTGDLNRQDFSIKLKNENGNTYLPIEKVKELYCFNDITISTKLLAILSTAGIVVHFFNYYGNYVGTFYPKENLISGRVIVEQANNYLNNREKIAKSFVQGIANNIRFVLYHYYRHGNEGLKEFIDFCNKDVAQLLKKAKDINQIMFIEGTIWSKFYNSFKYFLPEDFLINKRVRRPPDNPMNAMISFGNTLLYTKTISEIYQTHLNQAISFLHEPSEARFSLSLDLSEAFKPIIVYKSIFNLVNNKKIKIEKHFNKEMNYSLLNEEGKKIFIEEYENRLNDTFEHATLNRKITYKQAIRLDGYKLIKSFEEEMDFLPFNMENKK